MDVIDLLSRLRGVRSCGKDRWIACCPAHEDRTPSLTIRLTADARILLHDFGGCDTEAVLDALGVTFTDLFPEPLAQHGQRIRGAFSALDALRCLASESAIVLFVASDIAQRKPVTEADADRLAIALGRITAALELVHHAR